MESNHRPPWYGDEGSCGPRSTASHWNRSSSFAGPRCRTLSGGDFCRSLISCVSRLSAFLLLREGFSEPDILIKGGEEEDGGGWVCEAERERDLVDEGLALGRNGIKSSSAGTRRVVSVSASSFC